MPDLLKELDQVRQRWLKAKKKGDEVMMGLWEKTGKKLKAELEKRLKND